MFLQSAPKDLQLFTFKKILQMLRCARHDKPFFSHLLRFCRT